jgi:membrane fusion protein, multidrug efflux system
VWIGILAIFAIAFVLVLRQRDDSAASPKGGRGAAGGTVTITTATATQGDIGVYQDSIGTVTPVYTASITSQVNGIVTAVHYTEGQIVHKGDPLIDIDARPYEATLEQAQGTLERDENVLGQAQMDLERYKDAWARNAIPKQTLDDQAKIVLQDQGTVKIDEGTVQYDKIQVEYCHIVSPITGRVGLRLVDPGNVVQSSGALTLAVVTQMQPITVIFTIPEDSLGPVQARLAQHAKLAVDALDHNSVKKIATGVLLTLDNLIDTTTATVKARASFDNRDSMLFPNQFVNVRLLVDTHHDATLVPSSTVQHNGQAAFVYVIQDNTAHMRSVQTGVSDGGNTEVTGINPGDELANSSFDKLTDNGKVQPAGQGGAGGGNNSGQGGNSGSNSSGGNSGGANRGGNRKSGGKSNGGGSSNP